MSSSREKILSEAMEQFYRKGYLGTSVDDIIAQAKVSKSNFYYHFRSKEDLGVVVLAQRREDYLHVWDRMLDDGTLCPRERLTRFMDYLAETQEHRMEKGGCPFGNLVAEMAGHSERFRCQLSELFVGLTGRLSALIAEGQRSGAFRRDLDAHEAAYLVIQATQGMLLMTKCNRTVDNLNRGGRLLIHLISAA